MFPLRLIFLDRNEMFYIMQPFVIRNIYMLYMFFSGCPKVLLFNCTLPVIWLRVILFPLSLMCTCLAVVWGVHLLGCFHGPCISIIQRHNALASSLGSSGRKVSGLLLSREYLLPWSILDLFIWYTAKEEVKDSHCMNGQITSPKLLSYCNFYISPYDTATVIVQ